MKKRRGMGATFRHNRECGGRSCAQFYARVPLIEVKRGDGKEGMVSSRKCMCVCDGLGR